MLPNGWTELVALLAAFLISALTTPAGISGAVLLLPFQVSVLGTPGPSVAPTNLLYNVVSTPDALYRYWRQGQTGGRTDTLPLPPICVTALRIATRNQDQARTADWPHACICGERHVLVFTTRTGRPIEPRNINRAFDVRCVRYGVRRITLHYTRRTCGSLLAALDVH